VGLTGGHQIESGNPVLRCHALVKSIHVTQHRRCGNAALGQGRLCGRWWQWNIALIVLLLNSGPFLDLSPKRLELFRQTIPALKRVLYPYDPADAYAVAQMGVYRDAARRLEIELVEQTVHSAEEAQATLARVRKGERRWNLGPGRPLV
jgi:hypothetical protein